MESDLFKLAPTIDLPTKQPHTIHAPLVAVCDWCVVDGYFKRRSRAQPGKAPIMRELTPAQCSAAYRWVRSAALVMTFQS